MHCQYTWTVKSRFFSFTLLNGKMSLLNFCFRSSIVVPTSVAFSLFSAFETFSTPSS